MEDLKKDLIRLARSGFRLYDDLAGRLAKPLGDSRPARWELEKLMLATGRVQIAAKSAAKHVVPAALFYDYRFSDGQADEDKFKLCPTFLDAFHNGKALLETDCFQGSCPTVEDKLVVCPSGFWGYRHEIGFPTVEKRDAPSSIPYQEHPRLLVAVSTDKNFKKRLLHEKNLKGLVDPSAWNYADDTAQVFASMKEDKAQVVYFYCHGGKTADFTPYLEVGPRNSAAVITRGELSAEKIYWRKHPPLVFINGCHTTALDPEAASDLVSGFRESNAVGVIGTEITIFESLACSMAESFFRYFFGGKEVGDALRRARIDLLQQGNPLGLVYVPFVLASAKLLQGR